MAKRITMTTVISAVFLLMLYAGCAQQMVKGNIYRKNFKENKGRELLDRFKTGSYAILPFKGILEGRQNGIATDGNAIADLLSIQMLYQNYKVLEREKMQSILQEKALKESDEAESEAPDTVLTLKQLTQMGKILGVNFIITGSVIQYEWEIGKGGSIVLAVTITARVIEVQTGDIVLALSAGKQGNNLADCLDGITLAFTDALKEAKVYVWE
jgi:TolB-like protein